MKISTAPSSSHKHTVLHCLDLHGLAVPCAASTEERLLLYLTQKSTQETLQVGHLHTIFTVAPNI